MSLTLGPATKAAIARLVGTLPYLHSEPQAVPTQHRSFWDAIKAKYAAAHYSTDGDPKVKAALAHAEEEIAAALEQDNASGGRAVVEIKDANIVAPPEQPSQPEPALGGLNVVSDGTETPQVYTPPTPLPEPAPEPAPLEAQK